MFDRKDKYTPKQHGVVLPIACSILEHDMNIRRGNPTNIANLQINGLTANGLYRKCYDIDNDKFCRVNDKGNHNCGECPVALKLPEKVVSLFNTNAYSPKTKFSLISVEEKGQKYECALYATHPSTVQTVVRIKFNDGNTFFGII